MDGRVRRLYVRGLGARTADPRFLALARRLVDQVHHVLGRHRDDVMLATSLVPEGFVVLPARKHARRAAG